MAMEEVSPAIGRARASTGSVTVHDCLIWRSWLTQTLSDGQAPTTLSHWPTASSGKWPLGQTGGLKTLKQPPRSGHASQVA